MTRGIVALQEMRSTGGPANAQPWRCPESANHFRSPKPRTMLWTKCCRRFRIRLPNVRNRALVLRRLQNLPDHSIDSRGGDT